MYIPYTCERQALRANRGRDAVKGVRTRSLASALFQAFALPELPAHHRAAMALRTRARVLLDAAKNGSSAPGILENVRKRVTTGKLLRPDVSDDILRQPVDQAKFRFPSPG